MIVHNELNSRSETVWYHETNASNHILRHNNLFIELKEIVEIFPFGDASKVEVKEEKQGKIYPKNERIGMIEYVYFILKMKSNI
jgi:hypothetical protein